MFFMKDKFLLIVLLFCQIINAQIKGKVVDGSNKPIAFASVTIEKTYIGTSTNENGFYELTLPSTSNFILVVKSLGYKTVRLPLQTPVSSPINIQLENEDSVIQEILVTTKENPANGIIKRAIANRKKNTEKQDKFEADFYSRGIFRVKDIPKKFMGVEIGDFEGNLDSTGTGIIYQSETFSKIKYERPNKLKEEIIASKVAGKDNGFSFNTAINTDYNFYENTIDFNIPLISPISSNAFNYYKYKLVDNFTDVYGNYINKIKVTPKRDKEPVFEGFIYVVEDTWAVYGVEFEIKGYRVQNEFLESLKLVQNFNFNPETKMWVKNLQTFDFQAGFLKMKFNGKFTHVFNNYDFKEAFDKKTFSREVVSFVKEANKRTDDFWASQRPVPLTEEEASNYIKKDSIYKIRNSEKYLDSIDSKGNKFKLYKIITGYNYKKTFEKWNVNYEGLLNFTSFNFNTVQGFHLTSGVSYNKEDRDLGKITRIALDANYGFSDLRLRPLFSYYQKFNNKNDWFVRFKAGNEAVQFNEKKPISDFVNSISTLFFTNNFAKFYDKDFVEFSTGFEWFNGVFFTTKWSFENRSALINTTDYKLIKSNDLYTSNNPLNPISELPTFEENHIVKASIGTRFIFDQKYITRPDAKLNFNSGKYPILTLFYEKGLASNIKENNYDFVQATLSYNKILGNKGEFESNVIGGHFFNADNINFIDYKHFNGNQTHVKWRQSDLNSFNLMPYYTFSTNKQFVETHLLYNDNGYFLNKIPLINKLGFNLVAGYHLLNSKDIKPYQEFSVGLNRIGFGKYKLFKIEYVRNYQGGYLGDGVMFGLSL